MEEEGERGYKKYVELWLSSLPLFLSACVRICFLKYPPQVPPQQGVEHEAINETEFFSVVWCMFERKSDVSHNVYVTESGEREREREQR